MKEPSSVVSREKVVAATNGWAALIPLLAIAVSDFS